MPKLNLPDRLKQSKPLDYSKVRKWYTVSYFIAISLGILLYYMLTDLTQAAIALQPSGAAEVSDKYYYTYYLPYYAGVIIAALRPLSKKHLMMIFNGFACVGTIILAIIYDTAAGFGVGTGFIHFAGGFFEAITPVFCIFCHSNKVVLEVSPKEIFAVAGTIGYLATAVGRFSAALALYIAYGIYKPATVIIAFCIALLIAFFQLVYLRRFGKTPLEFYHENKVEASKEELRKMYRHEEDTMHRLQDIEITDKATDRYKIPIYKMILFPQRYRMALIIGIAVGFSQGIITIFFERFICTMADDQTTRLYCKEQLYNPESGFVALLFLNILAIGPTLFFLFRLERYGRAKLLLYGTFATIITLILTQIFSRTGSKQDFFGWYVYVVQGILLLYTIFIYSATLGPVFMVYLPEILPLSGVTIAVLARAVGKLFENVFRQTGPFSPLVMIGILSGIVTLYWYKLRESRGLDDIELYKLYLNDEELAKTDQAIAKEQPALNEQNRVVSNKEEQKKEEQKKEEEGVSPVEKLDKDENK